MMYFCRRLRRSGRVCAFSCRLLLATGVSDKSFHIYLLSAFRESNSDRFLCLVTVVVCPLLALMVSYDLRYEYR